MSQATEVNAVKRTERCIAHENSNGARISQRDISTKKPQDSQNPAAFIW